MTLFKITNTVDGDDDPLFVEASTEKDAKSLVKAVIGEVPDSLLKVVEIDELPEGEELLNEMY